MKRTLYLILAILTVLALAAATVSCGDDDDDNDAGDDDTGDDDDAGDDDSGDDGTAEYVVPPANLTPPIWPEWALQHWVWEDESTQQSAIDLVEGYLENDIPVGAIIIDSPWATGYNTFEWDTGDYPDAQGMIDHLHGLGARVMLWTTPNVNVDSPNYQEGLDNGYYVNDGRTAEWWKGEGSFIDYNNPDALDWWHGQIDNVLDMGIDGWKCDGTVLYMTFWFGIDSFTGPLTVAEYQALYYSDFFHYTREVLGDDRITTARPVDSYGLPVDIPQFAPVEVNVAGWVGDQDPTFSGLKAALHNMFASSVYGYVNFGSDIAGYRGDDIRDKDLFVRWAQVGALSPVMENGGAGEHRPWMYDAETLSIYRKFVELHHALIPYLYSVGAKDFPDVSVMRPVGQRKDYEWTLGEDLFVSAMTSAADSREVHPPAGSMWHDFWEPATIVAGGSTPTVDVPLDTMPIHVKQGAILPLDLRSGTVFGDHSGDRPPLTVDLYPHPDTPSSFDVYEEHGTGATVTMDAGAGLTVTLSATERDYAFRVKNADAPASVTVDPHGALDAAASVDALTGVESGYFYDAASRTLWVKPGPAEKGLIVTVE